MMTMRAGAGWMVCSALLSGCATTRSEKPVVTAKAVRTITKACGAVSGRLHRDGKKLPYVSFVTPRGEMPLKDGPTPTVKCVGERLAAYRYQFMGLAEDASPTD